ncbi:MAG: HypC/HybG/HupF family hydrogenase formation chaperone [Planctomycetaceae bacterium]
MCLAVPGKVVRWIERDSVFARADIDFDGVRRVCGMACVPDAREGDYVIVHAGIAIGRVDAEAAAKTLADLAAIAESARPGPEESDETP